MKKLIAFTLGSALIMNSALAFSDLTESHWAYKNVVDMQKQGIISGFEDNTFRPSDPLTRAQFITMAVKGLGLEPDVGNAFVDVNDSHWAYEYINAAGIVMATPSQTMNGVEFRPNEEALREDVAMAIVKLSGLENAEYDLSILNNFSDAETISENLKKYVAIAVNNGLMSGNADGTFSPKNALSRAEGATVIFNMLQQKEVTEKPTIEIELADWNGEYISNIDGLTKVKFTRISDGEINFVIKGKKSSVFGINNTAMVSGSTAKYEYDMFDDKGEINFSFDGSDLIIETSGYEELTVFEGRYKVNDGTISTIERTTEKNPLEGNYLLGEKIATPEVETYEELQEFLETAPLSLTFEISNIADNTAIYTLGGFVDGSMVVRMGSLEKHNEKWRDVSEEGEESTIEIEFVDGNAVIHGVIEDSEILSGTYVKQEGSIEDEFAKAVEEVDAIEIGEGGFMY